MKDRLKLNDKKIKKTPNFPTHTMAIVNMSEIMKNIG